MTADTVLGGVCIYLLLGVLFTEIFQFIEAAAPGSFALGGQPLELEQDLGAHYERYPAALYFSFVTLTTLGYGDITPVSPEARVLAITEAVIGQLYIAIFVARLVGLHLAGARRS